LLRVAPGGFSTEPIVHDHWEEVYLIEGDLVVGNDKTGAEGDCILHEIHYYQTSGAKR